MPGGGKGKPCDPESYYPIVWQQPVPKAGPTAEVRPRRQTLDPARQATILGEVLLRGIQETA